MGTERTLVLIKPDGVARGLIGEVIRRIERKGLRLIALEMRRLSTDMAEVHYAEHRAKPFFSELVDFITSGDLVAMVVEGERAIESFRQLAGATDPLNAAPGSVRGDFATAVQNNIVHGSDSADAAKREIDLFFPELT